MGADRDAWWEERAARAATSRERLRVAHDRLLADIARLPEHLRDGARELAAARLRDLCDEIEIRRREERLTAC